MAGVRHEEATSIASGAQSQLMKQWRTKVNGAEFKIVRVDHHGQGLLVESTVLDNPEAVTAYLAAQLPESLRFNADHENLIGVYVNIRRRAIGWEVISNGTLDTLLVHPREVFRSAIILNAAAIILAHNHPSGDPTPSEADVKVTRDMVRAGQLLKIDVMDHLILGRATADRPKAYASLRELGYFYT